MITGSCLCGKIQYELNGSPLFINYCHCNNCQKASGSFSSSLQVTEINSFQWLAGEELLSSYESSPGNNRVFCSSCGSRMPMVRESHITIPAGTLNSDPGVKPIVHIFGNSSPSWYEYTDSLPCFDGQAPNEFWENWMRENGINS